RPGNLQLPATVLANRCDYLLAAAATVREISSEHQLLATQLLEAPHGRDHALNPRAGTGDVVHLLDKRLLALGCNDHGLARRSDDVVGSAGANDELAGGRACGIDISEPVDLTGTHGCQARVRGSAGVQPERL